MLSSDVVDHRACEEFIAMAAHELRAPATVMAVAADTILGIIDPDTVEPRVLELLAMLSRNGHHMRRLAMDVLSAAYLERGELPLTIARVPLLPILRWGVDGAGPPAGAVRIECDPHVTADVDSDRLEQIITNLVANALQHGQPPVVVTARATSSMSGATVAVRDFGRGIAADDADHVFDRFSPLAAQHVGSSGLGLSIAKGLARAMGGDLTYRPADPGSLFSLTLRAA